MSLVLADVQPTENPKITEITVLEEFEGMTNGEVIQALFPCTEVVEGDGITGVRIDTKDIGALMVLYTEWWNAPYKEESK